MKPDTKDAETARKLFTALDDSFRAAGITDGSWFRPGIEEREIAVLEQRLNISLPIEYREIFKLFNGFNEANTALRHSGEWFTGFYLAPLNHWGNEEDISLIREFFFKPDGQLKDEWKETPITVAGPARRALWHPRWYAITTPSAFYSWYADFAPDAGGSMGQVVFARSDPNAVHVEVVAPNFFEFVEIIIDSVRSEGEIDW
jgi:cell wall assembly regulator SMI1